MSDPRLTQLSENLYQFQDICNVYILVDQGAALIIDTGSGAVLDVLSEMHVNKVEWVLHTHHHRDQCAGTSALAAIGAKVAVPEHERYLFEDVELYWQTRRVYDNYDDRNTFFATARNIGVDVALEDYETFSWRGYRLKILPAKGHTRGSLMLVADVDAKQIAFTGDLLSSGGKLYQLHAMEYSYGQLEGMAFTVESIETLSSHAVEIGYPSHGIPIMDLPGDLLRLKRRLTDCVLLGNGLRSIASVSDVLAPMQPLSRHLLWGGPWTCSNFYVLLSKSGKAMFVDYGHSLSMHMHVGAEHYGMESMRFVAHHLDELRENYGVTEFDLVVPTHIHDDHTCGIPYLQRHHGTRCWALSQVAQVIEDPAAWASTPCTLPKPIRVDRYLNDGESFTWEEYKFDIYHAPGQTEFHSVYSGQIDGRRVAFTGDNFFMEDVLRGGKVVNKAYQTTVLRNSFQLSMHRRCAEVMRRIEPDLICPGHRDVIECSKQHLDDYADFIDRKERVFRNLVADPVDHHIDIFWVRLLPYLSSIGPGQELEYQLMLRNNQERTVTFKAILDPPNGWTAGKPVSVTMRPWERVSVKLSATSPDNGDNIRRLMTAQIWIDGSPLGQIPEALVTVIQDIP